jgi:lauroyl/myristoyl acyltransferase
VARPAGDWTSAERFDEDFIEAAGEFTQSMATQLEEGIVAHPAHWHMLQPVFIADLDSRRAR